MTSGEAVAQNRHLASLADALVCRAGVDGRRTGRIAGTALPIEQDLFGAIDIDGQRFDNLRPHWFPWTMPFNMTGHPAIGLPCGFGGDGLPIGLQLVGGFRDDAELLRVSALFEVSADLLGRWPVQG